MSRSLLSWLTAVLVLLPVTPAVAAGEGPPDALTVLPPGNSMRYTVHGQARGTATGDPDDFGPNVDDQREMYWSYEFKDGRFRDECAEPESPRDGVRICLDDFGVPAVYGETDADVWYGAGYAVARLRLFLMDAVRRTARGTLAELTGPSGVPADIEQRVHGYTDDELQGFYDRLSTPSRTAIDSYIEGVNHYIEAVLTTRADELPAEYVLLGAEPEPLTHHDVLAAGVLMTRFVAAEGGTEMENVAALRALEGEFGRAGGRGIFEDLVWQEDGGAVVTVPREEGVFPRTTANPAQRAAAFEAMADYAATVPLELRSGPGTGDAPAPEPGPGSIAVPASADPRARAVAALEEFRAQLDGGSFLVAIAPERTADGSALLISEPQLGYNPVLLVEIEVHGGGYHARGTTVPGLPVVGIGYGDRVAWALTTGNSKTIDSFIERTRPDSDGDGAPEYLHDGTWKPQTCRTEEVRYRAAVEGVPVPGDVFSQEVEVCRTVHGPVVATTEDGSAARSVQYAMWDREVDTIEGVLAWSRAQDLDDFEAAMRKVTWNENVGYADADGHIAFWHPGLHHVRDPRTDLRLPIPGTGEYDQGGHLSFDELPHAVDPGQGFLANWNNKPAHGWLDGAGMSYSSYPAGHGQRVTNLMTALAARDDWTFEALRDLDRYAAEHDMRATEFLPLLLGARGGPGLTELQAAALSVLAAWDGSANGPGADMRFTEGEQATVGAAPTLFGAAIDALVDDLLAPVALDTYDLVERQLQSGRHVYDVAPAHNLVLRLLDPSTSTLRPSRDYLRGRQRQEVVLAALDAALAGLGIDDPAELEQLRSGYRMEAVCSATGVIGPCGEMPFLERGTWIHLVGFRNAGAPAGGPARPTPGVPADRGALPATGGGLAVLAGAMVLVGALSGTRRRRTRTRSGP